MESFEFELGNVERFEIHIDNDPGVLRKNFYSGFDLVSTICLGQFLDIVGSNPNVRSSNSDQYVIDLVPKVRAMFHLFD